MNELLMAHYLLKTNPDKRFRRWVLDCMVGKTYYHNFVTHFLEAVYQREVYRLIDAGGSVQAETLNRIMRETLQKFWGDAVEICEGAELTWMRQPHYYMGLYSYTYSAGLTVATQVCRRIEEEGQTGSAYLRRAAQNPRQSLPKWRASISRPASRSSIPLTPSAMIGEICQLTEEI